MNWKSIASAAAVACSTALTAQPRGTPEDLAKAFSFTRIAAVAEPDAIPLYATPTGNASSEVWDTMGNGQRVVRNVTRPTLTPVLPAPGEATGAALIVAPGGGFAMLSMDNEGWPVARWLADHGIAAFVLKYRLLPTPADEKAFTQQTAQMVAASISGKSAPPDIKAPLATQDALAAIKMVRDNARKWGVDPKRVGIIGFSAGAMTSLRSVLEGAPDARPNFFGYIYGPMQPVTVPAGAPPMFAALAIDDPLFGGRGFGIVDSWHQAKLPVELHVYEAGSHGFGMGAPGTTSTMLMPEFQAWMQARGLLRPK